MRLPAFIVFACIACTPAQAQFSFGESWVDHTVGEIEVYNEPLVLPLATSYARRLDGPNGAFGEFEASLFATRDSDSIDVALHSSIHATGPAPGCTGAGCAAPGGIGFASLTQIIRITEWTQVELTATLFTTP